MNAGKKVGFAVVGLGSIAQSSVLPAFANCRKCKLIALVSRDKKKARALARKFKTDSAYSSDEYDACLANPDVSAIYIATPQGEHEVLTVKAAQAGKHVLCEKPLAATVEQSGRMVTACRQHGVLLMTAYRKHFDPSTVYLKELIRDGSLGRIDVIHSAFSELHVAGRSIPWLLDKKLAGGGPLMDLGVYCVNTSRWLVDEDPVEVSAQAWRHDKKRFRGIEEGISFRMNFRSGLVVQAASTYSAAPSSFIHVQGSKGWALLSPAFPFEEERRLTGKLQGCWFERRFKVVDEFAPELDALAAAIQTGGKAEPDGRQGHRDVVILHSIYESARKHARVVVQYE